MIEAIDAYEFITAYTPYQAEISQGMLQALFEYQSLISDLAEMDVTNSSMYDGPTSMAEAARMAYRITGNNHILVPDNIYRNHLEVLKTYCCLLLLFSSILIR